VPKNRKIGLGGRSRTPHIITHMVIMARIKKMIRMIMYGMSRPTRFRR
jgi:hypothetical protein